MTAKDDLDATLRELLSAAGIAGQDLRVRPLVGHGMLNEHLIVEAVGHEPLVVRRYGWPFPVHVPRRADREADLLRFLALTDVPAPRVRAATDEAILITYEPGRLLAHLVADPTTPDSEAAWREAGRVARRLHALSLPTSLAVRLRGGLRPHPNDSWAETVIGDVWENLAVLAEHRPDLDADGDRIVALFERSRPLLEARPEVLLHGDLHPWNVLLVREGGRWSCSALLDWEFAEVGDPLADLVRFDLLRDEDIGSTPPAFLDGYGPIDSGPVRALYEMAFHLWMAGDVVNWPTRRPSHDAAETYVRTQLSNSISRLEAELNRA